MTSSLLRIVGVCCVFFLASTLASAQVNTLLTVNANGSYPSEVGFQFINLDNGKAYYCEPFGGSIATNITIPMDPGNYEVRAWDSYGDSWNGAQISLTYSSSGNAIFTRITMSYNCGYCPTSEMVCPGPTPSSKLSQVIASFTIVSPCGPPTITQNPLSQNVCGGGNITFSVTSTMTNGTYEWRRNGATLATTTTPSFTLFAVTSANDGLYDVVLRDNCNPVTATSTSASALLTVVNPPTIVQNLATSRTVCENASDTLRVRATGAGLRYQWRRNGVNITGATDSNYVIANMTAATEGTYDCVVSGTCAPTVTSVACNVIAAIRPRFTVQPANLDICPTTNGSIGVAASGTNLVYQWFRNDVAVPGATGASLSFTNYNVSSDGQYYCMVSSNIPNPNNCPLSIRSATVRVTGFKPPVVTSSPKSTDACIGSNIGLVAEATGSGLNFQWFKNGVPVTNGTSNELMLRGVKASDAGVYRCRVTGTCGFNVTTDSAVITVISQPVLKVSPQSQTIEVGKKLELTVDASDWRTLQWMKNNQPITGATAPSYVIDQASKSDAGYYYCIVRNSCGGVTSPTADIKVVDPSVPTPAITLGQQTVEFGDIPSGYEKSVSVAGLIQSSGTAPLLVSGLAISSPDFTITNAPATPFTLAPGTTQTVTIKAAPTRMGGSTASLVISSNAPANPNASVALSAAYVLRYDHPAAENFGKVMTDESSTKCVTITNTSTVDITIEQTTVTGANSGLFTVETATPLAIGAGQTAELCVKFTPGSAGNKTATLNLRSSTGGNSSIGLSGMGEIPGGVVEAAAVGVTASPNPMTDAVDIRFATPTPEMTVTVVSATGQTVAMFNHGAVDAGGVVRWNGRDTAGTPVASGAYTLVVRYGDTVATMPLTIVR